MGSTTLISQQILLDLAKETAVKAGRFIKEKASQTQTVNESTSNDIKIQLDVDTQKLIVTEIKKKFPDHEILGEEGGEEGDGKGYDWVIDPIDGTVNFFYGIPHFCVSIACRYEHEIILGAIYDPSCDELFYASKGEGAFLNDKKISVSTRTDLKDCIISTGPAKSTEGTNNCIEVFGFYIRRVKKIRLMGSAALDYAYLACGRLDAFIEGSNNLWDLAAGKIIVEEAGGRVEMRALDKKYSYAVCASNGKIKLDHNF